MKKHKDKNEGEDVSAVNTIVTPQGVYKVTESGCVDYIISAVGEEDAIKNLKEHLLEVAYSEAELEHVDLEATRYDDDDKLTLHYLEQEIELRADEWYAISLVADFEWNMLGCSEW